MNRFNGSQPVSNKQTAIRLGKIASKRGAIRRYNAIMRQCYLDMKGGAQYGIDWPTLAATWPDRAQEIKQIKSAFPYLPD